MARSLRLIIALLCLGASGSVFSATYWLGASSYGFSSSSDACKSRLSGSGFELASVSGTDCLDSGGRVRSVISSAECSGVLKKGIVYLGFQTYSCVTACPDGVVAVDGYCSKDCSVQPTLGSAGTSWIGNSDSSVSCIGGCAYVKSDGEGYWSSEYKVSVYKGKMSPMGGSCAAGQSPVYTNDPAVNSSNPSSGVPANTPPPDACKSGQVPYKGTVNGQSVTVCGAATKSTTSGTSSSGSSSTTTTNSGGTQSSSTSSGSTSKTTTTSCENGKCTTTTTTNGTSNGGAGTSGGTSTSGTETKEQPVADYCKDNPKASVCKDSGSSFGGSCGAFSCDGDAVQCAIASEQHQRNCEVFEDTKLLPQVGVGQSATDGTGSGHFVESEDSSPFSLASYVQQFENTLNLPSTCIADQSIPFAGGSVVLPFSEYCDVLRAFGYAGNGVTMVVALGIVFGSRRK